MQPRPHRLLPAGGKQHQEPFAWPPDEVGQQIERCRVRPMGVVDEEHAWLSVANRGEENLGDPFEEAGLRPRTVKRRSRRQARTEGGEFRHQAGCLAQHVRRQPCQPAAVREQPDGGSQALDERPKGQVRLSLVAAGGQRDRAQRAHVGQELLGQPRLADAGLTFQQHDVTGSGSAIRGEQLLPLPGPTDEWVIERSGRGRCLGGRGRLLLNG